MVGMDFVRLTALMVLALACTTHADNLPTCQAHDFHYEYTECDSNGGRWRVSVPTPNVCTGGAPNPPVRGKGCDYTCDVGQYLDMDGDQECHPCPPGSYSLGGGARFDDWEKLPTGFSVTNEQFISPIREFRGHSSTAPANCSREGWVPKGKHLASTGGDCSATLVYTANLVKEGSVSFEYQYIDRESIFNFQVQNSQCQAVHNRDSDRYPSHTTGNDWKLMHLKLKSGLNTLMWRVMGMHLQQGASSGISKPVLIKSIEVNGLAFTSECAKCKAGTFSQEGAATCEECPRDTRADKGATECTPCDKNSQYSEPASAECSARVACTDQDYFSVYQPCDANKKTKKQYAWIEPHICSENLPGAATIPLFTESEDCPPCNPGMQMGSNGTCAFCEAPLFSDGSAPCEECPASTAPETSLTFNWWNNLPPDSGFSSNCLTVSDLGCRGNTDAWQPAVEYIQSNSGFADDSYLVLSLDIEGFRGEKGRKASPVAQVSFVFEMSCVDNCSFFFMQEKPQQDTTVINTWQKAQPRQLYTYNAVDTGPVSFIWAFQKYSWDFANADVDEGFGSNFRSKARRNDYARIYSVNITNTVNGGAPVCKACPKGADPQGCVPCPKGQYVDPDSTQCTPCPAGMVVHGANPWGVESCVRCGEGLQPSQDRSECVSSCAFTSSDGKEYDFHGLSSFRLAEGSRLFTGSGVQYYHLFNISLCGGAETQSLASCQPNITVPDDEEGSALMLNEATRVSSAICRLTVLPPMPGDGGGVMAVQPVSLGDSLMKISTNASALNLPERMKQEGFQLTDTSLDVHFVYASESSTEACPDGRSTVITLHCDASQQGNGTLELPPSCADGTCDGCNYHFVLHARQACPVCRDDDFTKVTGECVDGEQIVHRIPPSHCVFLEDSKQTQYRQTCSIKWPLWLSIIIWVVPAVVGLAIILIVTLVYCWMKNRSLQYKYHKLVEGKSGSGELPAAETCGLDDEDEDEEEHGAELRHFETVDFSHKSKTSKLFGKLKSSLSKRDDSPFERIQLSEKDPLT